MGRKVGLTREDVVSAAAEIADAEGLEAVTLATVAGLLGVRSPSLYAHVAGLEPLRRELALLSARQMAGSLRQAVDRHRGIEALRRLAYGYRGFAQRHPGMYQAAQRAVRREEDAELYAALAEVALVAVRALEEAGVAVHERIHLTRALRSALHGFVALEQLGGFGMPESVDESFAQVVDLLLSAVGAHINNTR